MHRLATCPGVDPPEDVVLVEQPPAEVLFLTSAGTDLTCLSRVLAHPTAEAVFQATIRGLALDCLALVSGVGFMGDSMTAIAKRHKVTRAAVSKRCIHLTEQLDLLPSRSMKSLTARTSYRTAQTKNHDNRERFDDGRGSRSSN